MQLGRQAEGFQAGQVQKETRTVKNVGVDQNSIEAKVGEVRRSPFL